MTLLMPEGTRLLHIGPAKTGTTSLQSGFHYNREALEPHGVHYAGRGTQPRSAAGAVALGRRIAGHRSGLEAWPRLVEEVRESTAKRVVISSETFARAGDDGAQRVVEAFGAERTRVVITMRPLVDMLSSSWQQFVQTGSVERYEDWLDRMLNSPDTVNGPQPEFWRKTRIDALARRWGALVGPEQVTVVSLAGAPRDFVLRTFEQFTGLPDGTLVPNPASDNVSLGFGVAETVRRFNELFKGMEGTSADLQAALIEFGAVRHLRTAPAALQADARIEVPQWAADRAAALTREMNQGLRDAGVRIVGDLEALEVPSRAPVPSVVTPTAFSTEAGANLLVGMMLAAGNGALPVLPQDRREAALTAIEGLGTKDLLVAAGRRLGDRVRRRVRRGRDEG
ncbi:hypothetical protein [Amnibacterium endophyticum]|uniref:Sulfotransferase family protein n=1 Tax=Amnibacterium endophyticum TaxID=2109337 RepID=A0ABW4LGH9_9MICO